jgi:hypothetical protein
VSWQTVGLVGWYVPKRTVYETVGKGGKTSSFLRKHLSHSQVGELPPALLRKLVEPTTFFFLAL